MIDPIQRIRSLFGIPPHYSIERYLKESIYRVHWRRWSLYVPGLKNVKNKDYVECRGYVSRSGLTYDICYVYDSREKKWKEKTGFVPIAREIVRYVREGLWHVATGRLPPKEFRDDREEFEVAMKVLEAMGLSEEHYRYLLIHLFNGFSIYIVRRYGIADLYAVDLWMPQGNLEIYRLYDPYGDPLPPVYELMKWQSVDLAKHVIKGRMFVVGQRSTGSTPMRGVRIYIDAMIIITDGELYLEHPEHGPACVKLSPGWYFILHRSVYEREGGYD